ncbi:hypothetical protein N8469_00255 [bacterium]|nr:hypothetical protein [bacterium]
MALTINTQKIAVDDIDFSEKASSGKAYTSTRKPITSGLNSVSLASLTGTSTTGWSTNGTVALSLESGLIKITGSGGSAPNGIVTVALNTIPGNYYLFCADKNTSSGVTMTMSAGVAIPSSPFAGDQKQIRNFETITSSYTDKRIQFQAVSDITYLNFSVTGSSTSAYARIDHIFLIDLTLPNNLEVTSVNGRAQTYNTPAEYNIASANNSSNSGYTVMSDGFVQYLFFPANDLVLYITNSSDYGVHGDGSLFIEGVLK